MSNEAMNSKCMFTLSLLTHYKAHRMWDEDSVFIVTCTLLVVL